MMKARKSFRLPDGETMARGTVFSATVRSKVVAGDELFILGIENQPEDAVVACLAVRFHEPEESEVKDD
jgi:hypothetical protein